MSNTFSFDILQSDGRHENMKIAPGDVLYILGANGTGKSSLLSHIYISNHFKNVRRILAHRQTWLASDNIDLSAAGRKNTEMKLKAHDQSPSTRFRDGYSSIRTFVSLYDLVMAENSRAQAIAHAVDTGDSNGRAEAAKRESPLKLINQLLRMSNIAVQLRISSGELEAFKNVSAPYGISQLSDGERNAILIAADVLTASPGTLFIIDEPERHLHRSIISPLLTQLFLKRDDCAFVISTHDILLPLDNPAAKTLLVRSCQYVGNNVQSWETDLVLAEGDIDESVKRDILGSRRNIIFVEGNEKSLDQAIYRLVFPTVSIVSKSSCREVMQAVNGIREAEGLHWVSAWGIIDGDHRSEDEVMELRRKSIWAIPFYSVESIYYHPDIMRRVAERSVKLHGGDASSMVTKAIDAAMVEVLPHRERLTMKVSERTARDKFFAKPPGKSEISKREIFEFCIDIPYIISSEEKTFDEIIDTNNFLLMVTRYPIRETPATKKIATALNFVETSKYEAAVRNMLIEDSGALALVQGFFQGLLAEVTTDP